MCTYSYIDNGNFNWRKGQITDFGNWEIRLFLTAFFFSLKNAVRKMSRSINFMVARGHFYKDIKMLSIPHQKMSRTVLITNFRVFVPYANWDFRNRYLLTKKNTATIAEHFGRRASPYERQVPNSKPTQPCS